MGSAGSAQGIGAHRFGPSREPAQAAQGVQHTPEGPEAGPPQHLPPRLISMQEVTGGQPFRVSPVVVRLRSMGDQPPPRPAAFTVASLLVAVVDRAQTLSGVHRPPMIEPYLALRGTTGDGMGLRSIWDQPHVRRVRDRYGIGRTRRSCEQLWPGMSVSPVVGLS